MTQGKHAKPNETTLSLKKLATATAVVVGAAAVPATFAAPASAATDTQWEAVAIPEAGGNWSINHSGDGLSVGGLQFQNASWQDALSYLRSQGIDTSSFPATLYQGMTNVPSKAQQILAGEALLHLQGRGAWANGNGSGLSASMFDGGPVPASALPLLAGTRWAPATPKPTTPPPATVPAPAKPKPSASGLPKPNAKTPSAVPLQRELKRTGYMDKGVAEDANYGPKTQAAVAEFHNDHPEYRWVGVPRDVTIGPKGWAHLRSMRDAKAAPPAPKPSPKPSGTVLPVKGQLGDGLIVGSGGSLSRVAGGHSGLDIIAPYGTAVGSAAAGTVVSMNASGSPYGLHVVVKHADGVYTLYAHMSAIRVSLGQAVAAGQAVGNVGSTGGSSGPHLHFEVRNHPTAFHAGVFTNPLTWLRSRGVTV